MSRSNHETFMQRACNLAALAEGRTHPNPMVGAVVVRRDRIIGEGYHRQAGCPHAEVEALRQAGRRAVGATLYVTLEPCCHHGRTPPCTDAIIAAGIRRVVCGMRDPNPAVRGKGVRALRRAGLIVLGPCAQQKCRALNPAFIHAMTTGRPYVIVKVGATLDGKIADATGRSRWITNAAARAYGHQWRSRVDGVLIGHRTLVCDNPGLDVRLPKYQGSQPTPIILVGQGAIPRRHRLVCAGMARPATWVVPAGEVQRYRWLAALGHDLLPCRRIGNGYDIQQLLRLLGKRGMTSILVEGGGSTIGAFLRAGCVNYLIVGLAPTLLGGKAVGWTDAIATPSLSRALHLDVAALQRFGDNVVVEGRLLATGNW